MTLRLVMLMTVSAATGCIPFLGEPTPAGHACAVDFDCSGYNSPNTCDTSFTKGYCTRPCSGPVGAICVWDTSRMDGLCGLPLTDGGLGCAQRCESDGGSSGFALCRSGYRCVMASFDGGACADITACPYGICIP